MEIVEHYRHSMRHPGGVHLTNQGVRLARRVGERLGAFDRVITSDLPRAFETAIAMGYAVDEQDALLSSLLSADKEVDWQAGCEAFAAAYRKGGYTRTAAQVHADFLRKQVGLLSNAGRLLVVSHGGSIELGLVGLLPEYDYSDWGPSCGYCEGVRLYFDASASACVRAEILRHPVHERSGT
jgi:broad specificity phosphatase PhoE